MNKINRREISFEQRVFIAIQKLEDTGLATSSTSREKVEEQNSIVSPVAISFVLDVLIKDLKICIACSGRASSISLEDINKIKELKSELPDRHVFWLVVEGSVNKKAHAVLKSAGITLHPIAKFESIISKIYTRYKTSNLNELRRMTAMIGQLRPALSPEFADKQHVAERKLLKRFKDLHRHLQNRKASPSG
jgi:hypothetical protein